MQEKIAAIGRAIAGQNGRVVGTSTGIASKMAGYERLEQEQAFAARTSTRPMPRWNWRAAKPCASNIT
jgi:capsular polysaccharide transport system permease protein